MKSLNEYLVNEGKEAFKNLNPDLYSLLVKLLSAFVKGEIDISEKDNKELIKDAKVLLFNLG